MRDAGCAPGLGGAEPPFAERDAHKEVPGIWKPPYPGWDRVPAGWGAQGPLDPASFAPANPHLEVLLRTRVQKWQILSKIVIIVLTMTLATLCSARHPAPASVTQRWKVRTESPQGLDPTALCPSGASEHRSFDKLLHPS